MARYRTIVEDGTVYVESEGTDPVTDGDRLEIGPVEDVLAVIGGHSWTITYTDEEKQRHPGMDTSDEGLTVDVVDVMQAMTHGDRFVRTLATHPVDASSGDPDAIAPRMGLFVGKLLENLENGLD